MWMKRLATGIAVVCALALAGVNSALATGQPGAPSVTCGEGNATTQPPGFLTIGFLNVADSHYAGNGAPSLNAASGNAISQYDVACLQLTTH